MANYLKAEAMTKCPYQSLGDLDRDVVWSAIAQLSEDAIREMATQTPELFYKWCVEAYTAKRKAELEVQFQLALLEKLQRCDPLALDEQTQEQSRTLVAA